MNRYLFLTFSITIIIISLISHISSLYSRVANKSIVLKYFNKDFSIFNDKIKYITIAYTSIWTIPDMFNLSTFNHRTIFIITNKGDKLLLSPTPNMSLDIFIINRIKRLNKTYSTLLTRENWISIINNKQLHTPVKSTSVTDVVNIAYKNVSKQPYTLLDYNCHKVMTNTINHFIKHKYGFVDSPFKLVFLSICELLDPTITTYHSMQK